MKRPTIKKLYKRKHDETWSHDIQHPCATHEQIDEEEHYNEIGFRLARSQAAFIKSVISSPLFLSHTYFFLLLFTACESYGLILDRLKWTCLLPFTPFSFLASRRSRVNLQWQPHRLYCSMVSSVHRRGLRGNKTVMHAKRLTVTRRIQFSPHSCTSRS